MTVETRPAVDESDLDIITELEPSELYPLVDSISENRIHKPSHVVKRQVFSFNNNLSALEAWMAARHSRRQHAARSYLAAIGKRDSGRPSRGLSVGLSVEAINNMLRAQRRRASANQARDTFQRLQIIG